MNNRVRLILLSLVITLLAVWLPATSYAASTSVKERRVMIKGNLVSQNEQQKTVEIKLTGPASYDGQTIGTVHLKGIPETDLPALSNLKWGKYGTIVELIAELDPTIKYPRKPYYPLVMAANFERWAGRTAEMVEEAKALAAQAQKEEAERKEREAKEVIERKERERQAAIEKAARDERERKEAAERKERERKEALERAAREEQEAKEAAERAEQERKEALERAARAEREAKEAAEREAKKQKELEAQPARLLVGKAIGVEYGNTLIVELGTLTYQIRNTGPVCIIPGDEVKVTVRRVDPLDATKFQCDFVSFDPAWKKAQEKKVAKVRSKESSLKAKQDKLRAQKEQLISKILAEQEKLEKHKEATTVFSIAGEIKNKEKKALQLWGHALPHKGVMNHWAMQTQQANIVVFNPNQNHSGAYYTGLHYFIKKASGKNAYGGSVPIWVFGDLPPKVKSAVDKIESKIEKDRTRILEIKEEVKSLSAEMGRVVCIAGN